MSLLLLTVTLRGGGGYLISIAYCLFFSFNMCTQLTLLSKVVMHDILTDSKSHQKFTASVFGRFSDSQAMKA